MNGMGLLLKENLQQEQDKLFACGQAGQRITEKEAKTWILAWVEVLQRQQVKVLAIFFEDVAEFSMVLMAAAIAKVDVYLPALLNAEAVEKLETQVDAIACDSPIKTSLLQLGFEALVPVLDVEVFQSIQWELVDIQITLHTSGSSGQPKEVVKTWQQMWQEAKGIADVLPTEVLINKPVVLSSVSSQHLYGLSFRVFLCLYLGLPMYRTRLVFPETLLAVSTEYAHCLWVSSPTLLRALNNEHQMFLAQKKVALVLSAGGVLPTQNKIFLQQAVGASVLEIYGSTETGVVAYRMDKPHWRFFKEVQYSEQADNGLRLTSLWCPNTETLADAIHWEGDGFELLGRVDRIIKMADKRISLLQIETKLLCHSWLQDAHVVKHPENSHLLAWLALSPSGIQAWCQLGRKEVIKQIKALLSEQDKMAMPRYWRFDTTLPRNAQSKISQQDVVKVALEPKIEPQWFDGQWVSENEYHIQARIPVDLQYFNGHFDSFHLVPGVVQLKWMLAKLQELEWLQNTPRMLENLKFQGFLRPNDVMSVVLKRDVPRQKLTFQCVKADSKVASGRLVIPQESEK